MRESLALYWTDYDKQSIRCHQSQLKNSNFKRENNHALLCQKYKAWIIWRNWQAWVTGANLDSYRCREWRLQLSMVHRSSCVTSCFLKSAHLFSLCDNPSIVMLLYALNMTRFLGFCRASVAFFVCSRRGQADFYHRYNLFYIHRTRPPKPEWITGTDPVPCVLFKCTSLCLLKTLPLVPLV